MARNEEKAQSMLYRFREAQAAELGIGIRKNERRPRVAATVKNLKECERWRGEVLREISRKVSKIQDFGLTDYEVRDLNDEINKLLREKNHWENQIIALGGANYKRAARMFDDNGKEVPGTRGYKYFGRAKDLPGVKELFDKSAEVEEQEIQRSNKYKRFAKQPAAYYGDEDEAEGILLREESEAEQKDWDVRLREALEDVGCSAEEIEASSWSMPRRQAPAQTGDKRLQSAQSNGRSSKRTKTDAGSAEAGSSAQEGEEEEGDSLVVSHLFALPQEQLQSIKVPDRQDIEAFLLRARKEALKSEYIG